MAGSEQAGFSAARPDLFEGAAVVITPTKQTAAKAKHLADKFWSALGAKLFTLAPDVHDHAVAEISHMPHLVAAVMTSEVGEESLLLAGGGFRDTTRIASGSPELWTEILWGESRCHETPLPRLVCDYGQPQVDFR